MIRQASGTGAIARLRAEIRNDRQSLEARLTEIASIGLDEMSAERSLIAQMGVALHHTYGAIESIMVRIAKVIEGSLPEGSDWHQALLADMALDIEGIRPAIIGSETLTHLRRLLAFRHFFRHAYAVDLDAARLLKLKENTLALGPLIRRDLDGLDTFLKDLAAELGP